MAYWTPKFFPISPTRDSIKREWRPILTFHSSGGWRCYRADTGMIGYGDTAREAWHDLWRRLFPT